MVDLETTPQPHYLSRVRITGLWHEKNFDLRFKRSVNVIVGHNGSGKTTIINIIRYVLSGDVAGLAQLSFERVQIDLKPFGGGKKRSITVTTTDEGFHYESGPDFNQDISVPQYTGRAFLSPRQRHELDRHTSELRAFVSGTVPAVWLPVTRRLPTVDEDEELRRLVHRGKRLESVDERLEELLRELPRFRIRLEALLAQEYKRFERQVLALILYREEYASPDSLELVPPTDEEKAQLVNAFRDADLMDSAMSKRIDEHFEASREAANVVAERGELSWEQVMVLPLIPRTQEMVRLATALEERRQEIFAPLEKFTTIVNGFLNGKRATIQDDGELELMHAEIATRKFQPSQLSSGEKQLLILLIEALLRESEPVVYVADEPELSLHVEWQEKLLESLMALAEQAQIVVATHSPDIVGKYQDRVLRLKA